MSAGYCWGLMMSHPKMFEDVPIITYIGLVCASPIIVLWASIDYTKMRLK